MMIEVAPEKLNPKREVFGQLDELAESDAILASNSSSLPTSWAIPELWPLGTEALAPAMEVSVLEAKRLGHRAVLRLSWLLLIASVALSTLLQVAVAPATLVGYLTAGATPVWLLGSFAVLSLLYRAEVSATQAAAAAEGSAKESPASAEAQQPGAEVLTKRAQAERVYAQLSADGAPSALDSWPPRLGSARATLVPWSPSSTPNRQPRFSATAAGSSRPTRIRTPGHDRPAGARQPLTPRGVRRSAHPSGGHGGSSLGSCGRRLDRRLAASLGDWCSLPGCRSSAG
jgi:3-hydroxyacyl-CoA dehydrogenase, NAD binding domain